MHPALMTPQIPRTTASRTYSGPGASAALSLNLPGTSTSSTPLLSSVGGLGDMSFGLTHFAGGPNELPVS